MFCKGKIVDVRFAAGCVEVIVAGEIPGAFVIDNCCLPGILDTEGPDLIGREIEYEDGQLQFVDDQPAEDPRPIIPFPYPARSQSHV